MVFLSKGGMSMTREVIWYTMGVHIYTHTAGRPGSQLPGRARVLFLPSELLVVEVISC